MSNNGWASRLRQGHGRGDVHAGLCRAGVACALAVAAPRAQVAQHELLRRQQQADKGQADRDACVHAVVARLWHAAQGCRVDVMNDVLLRLRADVYLSRHCTYIPFKCKVVYDLIRRSVTGK